MNETDASSSVSKSDSSQSNAVQNQNGHRCYPTKSFPLDSDDNHHCAARKLAEFENTTIQKQRQEMQLLVVELRSRDRELNEMVAVHRKQLLAWEQDRNRLAALEEKCCSYERELLARNEEVHSLTAKIRTNEAGESGRQLAVRNTQDQLDSITEQYHRACHRLKESQEVNRGLICSVQELKSSVSENEQKEHELFQMLSSKDRALSETGSLLAETNSKLKRCELQLKDSLQSGLDSKKQITELQKNCEELRREFDSAKNHIRSLEELASGQRLEMQQYRQKLQAANSEITIANEHEERKSELLQLSKSKQERIEAELAAIRELCDTQQRDILLLKSSLDTAKNLLSRKHDSSVERRNILGPDFSLVLSSAKLVASSSSCNSPRHPLQKISNSVNFQRDSECSDCAEKVSHQLSRTSSIQSLSLSPEHHSTKSRRNLSFSPTAVGKVETVSDKDLEANSLIQGVEKSPTELASLNLVKGSRNSTPVKFSALRTTFPDKREDDYRLNRSERKYLTNTEKLSGLEHHTPLSVKSYGSWHQDPDGKIECKPTRQQDAVRTIASHNQDQEDDSENEVVKDQISVGEDVSFNDTNVEEGRVENEWPSNNSSLNMYKMNTGASGCSTRKPYEQKFLIKTDLTKQENRFDYDKICLETQKCRTPDSLSSKTVEQAEEKQVSDDRLNRVSHDYDDDGDDDADEPASCRQSSLSTLSQYSIKSEPGKTFSASGNVNFPVQSSRTFHWSGSYEQLSETVGKDWARSCHWKPTGGEKADKACSSSYGFPSVASMDKGGHGDGKQMESTGASEAASAEKELGSLLLKYGASAFADEQNCRLMGNADINKTEDS